MVSCARVNQQGIEQVQKMTSGKVCCFISYGDENGTSAEVKKKKIKSREGIFSFILVFEKIVSQAPEN